MARRAFIALVSCALVFVGFPFGTRTALAVDAGGGSIALTTTATYSQDFNTLANGPDAALSTTLPAGWRISESGTSSRNDGKYAVGTGSSFTGDTYSFGAATGDAERALGQLRSGTLVPVIGAAFTNGMGRAITAFAIGYTGEQWRIGAARTGAPDRMDFQYSLDATSISGAGTWVDVDALDFSSPVTTGLSRALNGNDPANRRALTAAIAVNVPPGASLLIRWLDFDVPSSDDGLAVDDFTLRPLVTDTAPSLTASSPFDGAANVDLDANVRVTFSEPVSVAGDWSSLVCSVSGAHTTAITGGPATFVIDPDTDFAGDETCTVTIYAALVSDLDPYDPPDHPDANASFTFTTFAPVTPIHDLQGAAHRSPYLGQIARNAVGIVTAKRANGFYLQDPAPDASDATSEGIFVFTSSAPSVAVGDSISVRGLVQEFRPGGAATNLSTTELTSPNIWTHSTGNPLPAAVVIGVGRTPPTAVIEDDATSGDVETSGIFDPAADGVDFWESLESMRVEIPEPLITSPSNRYNELGVVANGGAGATGITARGGIAIAADDRNPERILVDDEILKANGVTTFPTGINVGDHFAGSVTGIVDYDFGNFMLELTESPTLVRGGLAREVTAVAGPFDLAIATFNVENLDPSDHTFATMASLIVDNLRSPDLVSLEEIQDNNGETDTGIVDATTTLTMLRDAIVAAGGPTYSWSEIDPVNDMDGGAPGGNIRQVFFYRTDRGLAFVSRPGADPTTPNAVIDVSGEAQLQYSPGRIDPTNSAFTSSRKPLAGEFAYKGHRLFVVANHFNSKGGDDPLWGRHQPPVLSSEVQRMQQARIVAGFVNDILAIEPNAEVVVLGDLNDFEFSGPLNTLKAAGLHDLIETLPVNERYTYVYEGNSQTLDHILVSDALLPVSTDDVVHVNSEFWDQASDHDPQVVRLLLPDAAGLCTLTRGVVSGAGIANSLCAKLNAAKASLARGDRNAFAGQINAYVNEVSAQRGKAISTADADELTMLAGML